MVTLDSAAGKALVAVSSGTAVPSGAPAREAARLFLTDVTQTLRWHAVVAVVALAATPLVYQVSRVVAQRYRAELVSAAKDAVQREELFNGAEADGVMIDPADEGGITISYNTLSAAKRRRDSQGVAREKEKEKEGRGEVHTGPATASAAAGALSASSTLAMRVGRRHSWALSSFAHAVLAAQRAPNVQFVRTCSHAAVWQYSVVALRLCTTSCALCVTTFALMHAGCGVLDRVVPVVSSSSSGSSASTTATGGFGAAVRDFVSAPLFSGAAPPSLSVSSFYGLYDFSTSACGVWSRLVPFLDTMRVFEQRLCARLQPLHMEWRRGGATPASPQAQADAVWTALTPRGYFVVSLLPRLPWRLLAGLQWVVGKASSAVMRRWCDTVAATSSPVASTSTPPPAPAALSPSPSGAASLSSWHAAPQPPAEATRPHSRLIHAPMLRAGMLLAGDVAFASVVFAATWWVSGSESGAGGPRLPVLSAAGARHNMFCWVQVVALALNIVGF